MTGGIISLTIPTLRNMEEGLVSPHWLVTTRITPSFHLFFSFFFPSIHLFFISNTLNRNIKTTTSIRFNFWHQKDCNKRPILGCDGGRIWKAIRGEKTRREIAVHRNFAKNGELLDGHQDMLRGTHNCAEVCICFKGWWDITFVCSF